MPRKAAKGSDAPPRLVYVLYGISAYVETFIRREIETLVRRGFDIRICCLHRPDEDARKEIRRLGWNVVSFPVSMRRASPSSEHLEAALVTWLAEQAMAHDAQLIHAHFSNFPATLARLASHVSGIPYSVSAHATDIYMANPNLGWNIEKASLVVTCNRRNRAHLARRFPALRSRIRYAYHGIDLRVYALPTKPRVRVRSKPLRLVVVSRLEPVKGVSPFLRACALLVRKGVSFRADIAGDGPARLDLEREAKALGLGRLVHFHGALPHERVRGLYLEADIVVQPSIVTPEGQFDNLPNVVLEAMALARPVIASRVGAIAEAIEDDLNGVLVPPNHPAKLAQAIAKLGADHERAARLGAAARITIEKRYDLERSPVERLLRATIAAQG
ncbi:MAG: glycosyltransferase family 4 protein [Polyangiaceae bacterium]